MTAAYDQALASLQPAGRRVPAPYGLLEVSGRDAVEFVHRLCSQDVQALTDGSAAPASFLDPKGRVQAIGQVVRHGEAVLVETQAPQRRKLFELLDRYHFTEQLVLRERDDLFAGEARGTAVLGRLERHAGTVQVSEGPLRLALAGERGGIGFVRMHGSEAAVEAALAALDPLDDEAAEALRILAAEPWVGLDTEATTLALEAGLDDHISTTKGCYTGQEIVARIHTYGHVNRRLVRLRLATVEAVAVSTPLCLAEDGTPLGRVMSAARLDQSSSVALGYLPETFLAEPEPLVLGASGGAAVEILEP